MANMERSSFVSRFLFALWILGFHSTSAADPCRKDFSELNDLVAVIESIAAFELNEIQRPTQPPSTKQGLQESLALKISDAAKLSGLPEEEIRRRIRVAKQAQVFGPRARSAKSGDALSKELSQLPRQLHFMPARTVERERGDDAGANNLVFSADSRFLIGESPDRTFAVRIWEVERAGSVKSLEGHTSFINSIRASGDGTKIISSSSDKTPRVWDMARTHDPIVLSGHTGSVNAVAISYDGKLAVSTGEDQTLRIWDVDSRRPLRIFKLKASSQHMALSADGSLAAYTMGFDIYTLDMKTGKTGGKALKTHEDEITSIAITPDGKNIVSGSLDGTVRVWDSNNGKQAYPPKVLGAAEEFSVYSVAVSPDGKYIAGGAAGMGDTSNDQIFIWGIDSPIPLQSLKTNKLPGEVAFSPDGKWLACAAGDVLLWKNAEAFDEEE